MRILSCFILVLLPCAVPAAFKGKSQVVFTSLKTFYVVFGQDNHNSQNILTPSGDRYAHRRIVRKPENVLGCNWGLTSSEWAQKDHLKSGFVFLSKKVPFFQAWIMHQVRTKKNITAAMVSLKYSRLRSVFNILPGILKTWWNTLTRVCCITVFTSLLPPFSTIGSASGSCLLPSALYLRGV